MLKLLNKKGRLFDTSFFLKKIFSMFSLLTMLSLSIFLLFQEKDIPINLNGFLKTGWNISLLFILWFGISYLDKNLHISKYDRYFSYYFSLIVMGYLYFMVFYNYNYVPKEWMTFKNLFYWFIPIIVIDIIWKLFLSYLEYKSRPFYSRELFWKAIAGFILCILVCMAFWNFYNYWIKKKPYNYLDTINIINWFLGFWLVMFFLFINFKIHLVWRRYSSLENQILTNTMILNSFIKITSFFVWSINVLTFSKISFYEIIYLSSCLTLSWIIIMIFFFHIYKRRNNLLILILMISLLTMSSISFIFIKIFNVEHNMIYIVSVGFILFFNFIIIISDLKLSYIFHFLNNKLSYFLMLNSFFIWIFSKINLSLDIFNIQSIFPAIKLAYISALAIVPILSILKSSIIINRNISKLYSIKIKENKIKLKQGGISE